MYTHATLPTNPDAPLDESTLWAMIQGGENLHVEFKGESKPGLSNDTIIKSVVGLANKGDDEPGWLLLGVEDESTLSTSRTWGQGRSTQQIQAIIEQGTKPTVQARVQEIPIHGRSVTVIRVTPTSTPVCTSKGRFVRRTVGNDSKPASQNLDFNQIQSIRAAAGLLDFTELVEDGVTLADLNPLEFERLRQRVRDHPDTAEQSLLEKNDEDICRTLGAVEYDSGHQKVCKLGLLLFGHEAMIEELIPTHRVAYQIVSHKGVHFNEIRHWPLFRAMDELDTALRQTAHEDEVIFGMQRVGFPQYHPSAVREAVANALVHRDYFQYGTVQVRWLLNENLDISNPGDFPRGVSLTSFLVNGSKPRNRLLLRAFQRGGVVEEVGRGIRNIFQRQLLAGRPRPVYNANIPDHVMLIFDHDSLDLRMVRIVRHENLLSEPKPLNTLLLLRDVLRQERIGLPRAAAVLQCDEECALEILDKLVQRRLLSKSRRSPPSWTLSPRVRKICNRPLPLETAGFETSPLPRQNFDDDSADASVILDYVAARGRITRREVIDLCQLSPKAATRMLKDLTQSGALVGHGQTRRDAWYGLPESSPESQSPVSRKEDTYDHLEDTATVLAHVAVRGRITRREVVELCRLSPKSATRVLKRLAQSGYLVSRGRAGGRWYGRPETKPKSHSRSADQNSDDGSECTSMILAYAATHGRVTRQDVVDLCQLKRRSATRVLKQLTRFGHLVSHGRSGGSWYGLPETKTTLRRRSSDRN